MVACTARAGTSRAVQSCTPKRRYESMTAQYKSSGFHAENPRRGWVRPIGEDDDIAARERSTANRLCQQPYRVYTPLTSCQGRVRRVRVCNAGPILRHSLLDTPSHSAKVD